MSGLPSRPAGGVLRRYRSFVYLFAAGLAMIGYAYGTPPRLPEAWTGMLPLLGGLPGDFPVYAWRFLLSFLLLGALPLVLALLLGESPAGLGLRLPRRPFPRGFFLLFLAVVLAAAWIGGHNPEVAAFYPYSRTLLERLAARDFRPFALHALVYTLLYYLPWEVLFRGLLLFPFLRLVRPRPSEDSEARDPALLAIACLQALPSTMLHYYHPLTEVVAALPFGIALGYLALRTRSILPGLLLHALVGVLQDLVIGLRAAGLLGG